MASTYISRTLASNGQKKGTISVWFKVAGLGTQRAIVSSYYDANYHAEILLSSNDQIDVFDYRSGYVSRLLTNRLFRDIGAWYHLVYEFDSTNGVADDRNKLWINGVQETSFSSRTNYGSSASTSWDTDYSFRKFLSSFNQLDIDPAPIPITISFPFKLFLKKFTRSFLCLTMITNTFEFLDISLANFSYLNFILIFSPALKTGHKNT